MIKTPIIINRKPISENPSILTKGKGKEEKPLRTHPTVVSGNNLYIDYLINELLENKSVDEAMRRVNDILDGLEDFSDIESS